MLVMQLLENVVTSTVPVSTISPSSSSILLISFPAFKQTFRLALRTDYSIILSLMWVV